jgi:hypothetical protein
MPAWGWVLIGLGILALLALAVRRGLAARRTRHLRGRFGPEYDRTLERADGRRQAEAQLAEREARRERFDIRPLSPEARERYRARWHDVQARFVDAPAAAVASADALIQTVMAERGYPVEDFERRADDLSVDHPDVVEHYRHGHRLARRGGDDGTEDLRRAMQHYRALFDELVEAPADEPVARDPAAAERDARHEEAGARPRR